MQGEQYMPQGDVSQSVTEWAEKSWTSFDWNNVSSAFGDSSGTMVQGLACFGAGVVAGFVLKKYVKFLFFLGIALLISLKWLEFNEIVSVNWDNLQDFIGVQIGGDVNQILQDIFRWMTENIVVFLASLFGFLLGNKLG